MWRLKRWWYLSQLLVINITILFWSLFQLSNKTLKEFLKLKFRSKFNHAFNNQSYLHSNIWKALWNFKVKRTNNNQFFLKMLKIKRFSRSSKCLKIATFECLPHIKQTLAVLGLLVSILSVSWVLSKRGDSGEHQFVFFFS